MDDPSKGWYSRGYLPHFDGNVSQFVTFRLFDSLPQKLLHQLRIESEYGKLDQYDRDFQIKIERYLDQGIGSCYLRRPDIADMAQNALRFYDKKQYRLIAWVIMPNHVHLLIKPNPGSSLPFIMKNLKGFTSREANRILKRRGSFWQLDYFDRFIRDEEHYLKTVAYIVNNPVKAGLCKSPSDWRFSSAWIEI